MLIALGTLSPLAGIAACVSLQFGANEMAKRILRAVNVKNGKANPDDLTVRQFIFSGGMAGAANTIVSAPVENIRIIMQVNSSISCFRTKPTRLE